MTTHTTMQLMEQAAGRLMRLQIHSVRITPPPIISPVTTLWPMRSSRKRIPRPTSPPMQVPITRDTPCRTDCFTELCIQIMAAMQA